VKNDQAIVSIISRNLEKLRTSESKYLIMQLIQLVTAMWPIFPRIVVYGPIRIITGFPSNLPYNRFI
jgi:hypothetical protein